MLDTPPRQDGPSQRLGLSHVKIGAEVVLERVQVSVEIKGRTHVGSFEVRRGIITVRTVDTMKTTQLGNLPPETLARMLLREIVQEAEMREPGSATA